MASLVSAQNLFVSGTDGNITEITSGGVQSTVVPSTVDTAKVHPSSAVHSTSQGLKLIGGSERQAALALEKCFQAPVAGTALAPDNLGGDAIAQLATIAPPFQPVFIADGALNRDAGDS